MEKTTIFLVPFCVSMLVMPSTCQKLSSQRHGVTIRDSNNDVEMVDNCEKKSNYHYCTSEIGNCRTGTHVMCMAYTTDMIMGDECHDGAMFNINPEMRETIIDAIEALRNDALSGQARGKGNTLLPQAYDLVAKLSWDPELAMFAQVWTNQCRRKLDACRDSKRFKDVDQFIGADFFTRPDWEYLNKPLKIQAMKSRCLTKNKVKDAIKYIIQFLIDEPKEKTTKDLINQYDGERNTYLMLLYGKTTHIGCGMSYYVDYKYNTNQKRDVFVLQLVCNLSHKPVKGLPIYNTNKLIDKTEQLPDPTHLVPNADLRDRETGGQGPGFVIMPIITVEDAPLDLTQQRSGFSTLKGTLRSIASGKSSIFSSNGSVEDKISLKKKLKTLLEQVPKRKFPQIRELLKQLVSKHKFEDNQISTQAPVEKLDTVGSNAQEHISGNSNDATPILVNVYADDDISELTNGKLKEINHDLMSYISDEENYPYNEDIINIKDTIIEIDGDTSIQVPYIRKLKPIVHAIEDKKSRKSNNEKTLDRYSAGRMTDNTFLKGEIASIEYIDDKTNMGSKIKEQPVNNAKENNINSHKSAGSDDIILKRRMFLQNEVSKLKRKLLNIRQYIPT